MVILFALLPGAKHETQATIDALAPGVDRSLRQLARDAQLPRPVILWSGAAATTAFDAELFKLRAVGSPGLVFLYDDAAPSALERVQRVTP